MLTQLTYLLLSCATSALCQGIPAPAPYVVPAFQPFNYTHLYSSCDGISHTEECTLSSLPQGTYAGGVTPMGYSYSMTVTNATTFGFIQMPTGQFNGPHNPPAPQFVTVLSGAWYVETGDGKIRVFEEGEIMFQDNTADNPAAMNPQHSSGTVDDGVPCNIIATKVSFTPTCDRPCPFS
ncbi:hypothetical protein WJX74_007617 [Apatococcus lobatus]|uniref:Uncharacterized protein n=1 Tax=Apatococcus lobatus TaxID=904363 RepID=A0AAW1R1B0_9CHLO